MRAAHDEGSARRQVVFPATKRHKRHKESRLGAVRHISRVCNVSNNFSTAKFFYHTDKSKHMTVKRLHGKKISNATSTDALD